MSNTTLEPACKKAKTAVEEEIVPPPAGYAETSLVKTRAAYDAMYKRSIEDPEGFWGGSQLGGPLHVYSPSLCLKKREGRAQSEVRECA